MKKKLALVLSLVLCCAMLSGCTTLTALMGKQMANAATDDTSGDTVTISREEYEKYKQFDKLLELMDIVDEGYFEDYDKQSLLDGAADGRSPGWVIRTPSTTHPKSTPSSGRMTKANMRVSASRFPRPI